MFQIKSGKVKPEALDLALFRPCPCQFDCPYLTKYVYDIMLPKTLCGQVLMSVYVPAPLPLHVAPLLLGGMKAPSSSVILDHYFE